MVKPTLEAFCMAAKKMYLPTILMRVGSREDAEDIFQETMMVIINQWSTLKDPETFAWRIINNLRLKTFNQKKLDSLNDDNIRITIATPKDLDPSSTLAYEHYEELLNSAIKDLAPDIKVMVINYLLGREYNSKSKTYQPLKVDEYCKKNNIKKSYFYEIIKSIAEKMRASILIAQ